MDTYALATFILVLAVGFGYLNYRLLKLPSSIGLTVLALLASLAAILIQARFPHLEIKSLLSKVLKEIRFEEAVLHWMLGFLLFAGALHVELETLLTRLKSILSLATLGVLLSTLITGSVIYFLGNFLSFSLPFLWCLIFGALIAPTDPVAVLAVLRKAGISKDTETIIVGESLLNDGVAVVLFLALLELALHPQFPGVGRFLFLFFREALGGIILGIVLGYIFFCLIKSVDDYQLEVLMTLTLVMLLFTLAEKIHVSGPLAVVSAGLLIGNHGRKLAMSKKTVEHVDTFWELIDGLLNTVLFLLIGLEVLVIEDLSWRTTLFSVLSILVVLFSRFFSVWVSLKIVRPFDHTKIKRVFFFTWSGLRGGIAVALVLSLPFGTIKGVFLPLTYFNVLFSVVVQGLSLRLLAQYFNT